VGGARTRPSVTNVHQAPASRGRRLVGAMAEAQFWDRLAAKYAAQPVKDVAAFDRKKAITRQHQGLTAPATASGTAWSHVIVEPCGNVPVKLIDTRHRVVGVAASAALIDAGADVMRPNQ
jgi:hypothetical protein